MIIIVTAIFSEAKAFIEYFNLQEVNKKPFIVYKNEKILLIISGMGKINSAIATTYISKGIKIKKIINIGICGTNNLNKTIGSLQSIKAIVNHATDKKYIIGKTGETLYCHDKIIKNTKGLKKNILIDMESFGFYKASLKFTERENIKIYKIISDHLETSHISHDFIYKIIKNKINEIIL